MQGLPIAAGIAFLWGLANVVATILVVYWIYLIQARLAELVREVRALRTQHRDQDDRA